MKCRAKRVYNLTIDGPNKDEAKPFIRLAHELSLESFGEGLDSLDMGDAMGAFIRLADAEAEANNHLLSDHLWVGHGIMVTMSTDWELFDWNAQYTGPSAFNDLD